MTCSPLLISGEKLQMAVRRPMIDMIDRGADPKIAHKKLDKRGNLIVSSQPIVSAPVLSTKEDVKENLLTNEKVEVITETQDKVEATDKKSEDDKVKIVEVKKLDKTPKPA